MRLMSLIPFLVCTIPAVAEPLTGDAFDSYTQGKTLFYDSEGRAYGAETYLRNRQVRWSFLDGTCQDGHWYPQGDEICFLYDGSDQPQCWSFELGDGGLNAVLDDGFGRTVLDEVAPEGRELICPGPDVGV